MLQQMDCGVHINFGGHKGDCLLVHNLRKMKVTFDYNPNRNGRIYPKGVFEKALKEYRDNIMRNRMPRKKKKAMKKAGTWDAWKKSRSALGELDHPSSSIVSLSNASHSIVDIKIMKSDDLKITIELLNTPSGKIAKNLIESIGKSGFDIGMRGVGMVQEDGTIENPTIIAWDLINKQEDE